MGNGGGYGEKYREREKKKHVKQGGDVREEATEIVTPKMPRP